MIILLYIILYCIINHYHYWYYIVNIIRLKITVNNPTSSDPHSGERGSRFFGVEAFTERKERWGEVVLFRIGEIVALDTPELDDIDPSFTELLFYNRYEFRLNKKFCKVELNVTFRWGSSIEGKSSKSIEILLLGSMSTLQLSHQ